MKLPWRQIEAFVRVAEEGSLTRAARVLGMSQPTLSRQIQSLEEELGVPLFVRHARGLSATDRAVELLSAARTVDDGVQEFLRRATGMRVEPEGVVRVSAAEPIAVHALGPGYEELRRSHPKIALEIVVDNSLANLSRREADIAVRMVRPTQPDLVAKRLGTIELGLFATRDYLARYGEPADLAQDVGDHTLIGFDRDEYWLAGVLELGMRPEQFRFRTDSILAQLQAALDSVGIAALHVNLAKRYESLVRVLPQLPLPPLEVWLVVHQDLRGDPAVRTVLASLEAALASYLAG